MIKKYIAGNSIKCVLNISKEVMKINKIPVINYAIEESYNSLNTFNEYKELNNKIDNRYRIALKLSSFNFDEVIIDDIIDMYKEKGIKILIDAESNELNNKYHSLTNKLIQKHNKNDFNIIKTYQMYRKDSLNILNNDMINFKDIYLGTKLVRGAYWNSENKLGHLYISKCDTDNNYNKGILTLYESDNKLLNILATHNNESINFGYLLNNNSTNFEFGHLMGMKENKYKNLLNKNQKINVYIPYGPYNKMLPYLFRRFYENIDTIKYMF